MTSFVYDAGALIAAERNDRPFWADHRARLELGVVPEVPSPVVARVSRSPRQAQLRRLLRGCAVVAFDEVAAHQTGDVLRRARRDDVVDASVVVAAARRSGTVVVTSDRRDIAHLAQAAGARVGIVDV